LFLVICLTNVPPDLCPVYDQAYRDGQTEGSHSHIGLTVMGALVLCACIKVLLQVVVLGLKKLNTRSFGLPLFHSYKLGIFVLEMMIESGIFCARQKKYGAGLPNQN